MSSNANLPARSEDAPTPMADTDQPVRFVTAASLFDGHDASINIMRRMLQASGAEVIHLGHNRSVQEIVTAAVAEDAQGIAISSYQGGHVEYFQYLIDQLKALDSDHIRVFGGGGGVIIQEEIDQLHDYGVARIYSPQDGLEMGLQGMIDNMVATARGVRGQSPEVDNFRDADTVKLARRLSAIENGDLSTAVIEKMREQAASLETCPVVGITGTGGSGKSSLTDELVRRFRLDQNNKLRIALLAVDPTRRKTGGALLGDRIRMNAIDHDNIFMRSLATREAGSEVPDYLTDIVSATRLSGFDLVIVETPGIGQGDAGIVPLCDVSLYVMTPEFGAASQLEKIDMLDYADIVAINKMERKGGQDAMRDVAKQVQRNRAAFDKRPEEMPVYGTIAARFNDDGVTALYHELRNVLVEKGLSITEGALSPVEGKTSTRQSAIIPASRERYLAEISECVRAYKIAAHQQADIARERQQLQASLVMLGDVVSDINAGDSNNDNDTLQTAFDTAIAKRVDALPANAVALLDEWPALAERYSADEFVTTIRDRELRTQLTFDSLSGTRIRKVSLPQFKDHGELLKFLLLENLPGYFPFTAGVFAFKRENEDPTRMFAGEGDAFKTNARFKSLSEHTDAKRLSTAFDSVTLYGQDPALRPDIYGKVGNSGVSIATVEDMQVLYDGFDLCDPATSVSMTINGPAPTILAFFFVTAFRQQQQKFRDENGREPNADELAELRAWTLMNVRGTVQADILKEDQGQNTCIFSTEFSLKVMGDIQRYFVEHKVQNFYSVSISGYHIAEAGANPITQLALTLANGFTYIESYLARGMQIDDFAPNLSFFFSNGMDPEYTVMGRVARRIWAVAMRERYGANERSQKLKYHIQTSGRSLHAQEMSFNDIRTTLQALIAVYDNCNSLHTNAYDEAITTPTEESVRRAVAIQLIINREWGLAQTQNSNQGSFVLDELTELVEEAVLSEFERISERGGVLGAMETGYQRGKIQDESLYYEHRKHDGSLPIIGVNTFLNPEGEEPQEITLARSTEEEKQSQLNRLAEFQQSHESQAAAALDVVRQTAIEDGNVFAALIDAAEHCSLGQLTDALFEVGGQYRRSM